LNIYSDNGTNFIGANNQLKELGKFLCDNNSSLTEHHAPHHGGIWEAGVKSAKHHLRRVLSNTCSLLKAVLLS